MSKPAVEYAGWAQPAYARGARYRFHIDVDNQGRIEGGSCQIKLPGDPVLTFTGRYCLEAAARYSNNAGHPALASVLHHEHSRRNA